MLISRTEARQKGLRFYFTGKPCKAGHIAQRRVGNWNCLECEAAARPSRAAYISEWQRQNKDKVAARNERWRRQNREQHREANRQWIRDNPAKANAALARRRARQLMATPSWADHDAINALYAAARRLSETTGIPHEVDHIIPLAGQNVRGLHVHWNLRIVTRAENRSKGTRLLDANSSKSIGEVAPCV